jgi:putative peptidoglycan lipid II flippase
MFMVLFKGLGIKSLAYGFVLGSLLQAVLLLPGFAKRVRFKLKKDWQDYMIIKSLFKKSLVVMASVLVFGLISPVQKILASNLPEGSISSLGFVERIICILVFLPSMALPIVLLPQLAGHFTFADIHKIRNTFSAGIRNALVITLPLLVTLFIFRRPIVHLLLQRGAFDEQATVTSAAVLACYLGAFLESERLIILYTLYAMRDVISPLFTGALSLIFFTLVALPLSKAFDSRGLALAYSVTILFYILTNLFVLKVKLKYIGIKNILSSASKIAVASIGSGALMWLAYKMLSHYIYVNSFGIELFKLLVAVGGGAVLYIKLCYVMNLNEAIQFQKILTFMKQQLLFKLGPLKDDN